MTNPYDTEQARQERLQRVQQGAPQPDTPGPQDDSTTLDDLPQVLGDIVSEFERWVVLDREEFAWGLALFVAHSFIVDALDTVAFLYVASPEYGCGKSNVNHMLASLCRNGYSTTAATPAAVSRGIVDTAGRRRTLIIDEIDGVFGANESEGSELMRTVLNGAYRRSTAKRDVTDAKTHQQVVLDTFGVKVLAGIENVDHRLPETLLSRCLVLPMRRATPDESKALPRFRELTVEECMNEHRDKLALAIEPYAEQIAAMDVELPEGMSDRAADLWEPLLQVATAAGGEWPKRALAASKVMVLPGRDGELTDGVQLISDCQQVFIDRDTDFIYSQDLADAVSVLEGSRWLSARGTALTVRRMAAILRPYGVFPQQDSLGDRRRGYSRAEIDEAAAVWIAPND